jgi:K+-transporting ATPase ATPase C chain
MFTEAVKQLKTSCIVLIAMSILTGILYPTLVTVVGGILFPWQVNGSLIKKNDVIVGSVLIGQQFTAPQYFWGRPSATTPYPYNAESSSGSNLDTINGIFLNAVRERVVTLTDSDFANQLPIPVDLVTSSGSGLDPEISPVAAAFQVRRVVSVRGLSVEQVEKLIKKYTQPRFLGFLGEPRVNVLQLNLALDDLKKNAKD